MHKKISILSIQHPLERRLEAALIALAIVLAAAYAYYIGATVLHVMVRTEAAAAASDIESAVAVLEQEYFAESEALDEELSESMGLAAIRDTSYVYRPGSTLVMSGRRGGI